MKHTPRFFLYTLLFCSTLCFADDLSNLLASLDSSSSSSTSSKKATTKTKKKKKAKATTATPVSSSSTSTQKAASTKTSTTTTAPSTTSAPQKLDEGEVRVTMPAIQIRNHATSPAKLTSITFSIQFNRSQNTKSVSGAMHHIIKPATTLAFSPAVKAHEDDLPEFHGVTNITVEGSTITFKEPFLGLGDDPSIHIKQQGSKWTAFQPAKRKTLTKKRKQALPAKPMRTKPAKKDKATKKTKKKTPKKGQIKKIVTKKKVSKKQPSKKDKKMNKAAATHMLQLGKVASAKKASKKKATKINSKKKKPSINKAKKPMQIIPKKPSKVSKKIVKQHMKANLTPIASPAA